MPYFQENGLQTWPPSAGAIAADWQPCLADFLASTQGQQLGLFLSERMAFGATIYPAEPLRALSLTPLHTVKVVILGQDPYHAPDQAEGLAFSVAPGIQLPPSLRNIFKELQQEGLAPRTQSGSLTGWAQQGVLLLNTCLTVERGLPASHAKRGWEYLTDAVIAQIAQTAPVCVYMLWGAHAQTKAPVVREIAEKHGQQVLLLQANHPSPLSALRLPTPFIGCGHFQQANQFLIQANSSPIDWQHTG